MATPALAINIANHKGTLLVSPVWGMVVFSALELAVSLVLGPSVSLVIGFSVSSVFGLFSLGVMVGAGLRFQVASYVAFRLLYLLLFYFLLNYPLLHYFLRYCILLFCFRLLCFRLLCFRLLHSLRFCFLPVYFPTLTSESFLLWYPYLPQQP